MQDVVFHSPTSLSDALAALRSAEEGKILGGGQSLLPLLKLGLAAPSDLVSLGGLSGLGGIRVEEGVLAVGASATHQEVHDSSEVRSSIPAAGRSGGWYRRPTGAESGHAGRLSRPQ